MFEVQYDIMFPKGEFTEEIGSRYLREVEGCCCVSVEVVNNALKTSSRQKIYSVTNQLCKSLLL